MSGCSYVSFKELATANGWDTAHQHKELVTRYHDLCKQIHDSSYHWIDCDELSVDDLVLVVKSLSAKVKEEAINKRDLKRGYSERDVSFMIDCGAGNRSTAIRWAKQANS